MSQIFARSVAIVAGLILGVISNWLYELLKEKGYLPDKLTLKGLIIIIIASSPFVVLTALPDIVQEFRSNMGGDARLSIISVSPLPEETILTSAVERQVILVVEYYLPSDVNSPRIDIRYLAAGYAFGSQPEQNNGEQWYVATSLPAEPGYHKIQLAGNIRVPVKKLLNGRPFQVGVFLDAVDDTGHSAMLASDKVTFTLVDK